MTEEELEQRKREVFEKSLVGTIPKFFNELNTGSPRDVGERVGQGAINAGRLIGREVNRAATQTVTENPIVSGGLGVIRGLFGTDEAKPALPNRAGPITVLPNRAGPIPVPDNQHNQALVLQKRHADRLLASDLLNPAAVKPKAGAVSTATPKAQKKGLAAKTADRTASILGKIRGGQGVEVIRGLQRSHKLFDEIGPGQDGEFTQASLQPGALQGIERLQRAGGEQPLVADIRADAAVKSAQANSGGGFNAGQQLIAHFMAQGMNLPDAFTAASKVTNPEPLKDIVLREALAIKQDESQPIERRREADAYARSLLGIGSDSLQQLVEFAALQQGR